MTTEIAKAADFVASGLIAGAQGQEQATAVGRYKLECFDKDGNLKWSVEEDNLVVNVGLQYMAGVALTSTAQITTWFLGLITGPGVTTSATDTIASKGWTEFTGYSNSTRVAPTLTAATNANPSVVTNSGTPANFNINATGTVGGAFLVSNSTKGGTTGTLFSEKAFSSPGDRSVVSGDILAVTYTFSLAG
jgi:hypothetical protein